MAGHAQQPRCGRPSPSEVALNELIMEPGARSVQHGLGPGALGGLHPDELVGKMPRKIETNYYL